MSLERAWVRTAAFGKGWLDRALTPVWEESTVSFARSTLTDDGHGGFIRGEAPLVYWTTTAHVDMAEPSNDISLVSGVVQRHMLRIFIRPPADPGLTPAKGDIIAWADPAGIMRQVPVEAVIYPSGLDNHLEIESETFS